MWGGCIIQTLTCAPFTEVPSRFLQSPVSNVPSHQVAPEQASSSAERLAYGSPGVGNTRASHSHMARMVLSWLVRAQDVLPGAPVLYLWAMVLFSFTDSLIVRQFSRALVTASSACICQCFLEASLCFPCFHDC